MAQLGYLDGIRGFMALWVLASHLIQRSNGPNIFLVKGGIAVDVFMLVSGILMSHNFYQRANREPIDQFSTWGRFFIRRFFRIAPLYYLLFALATLFATQLGAMALELGGSHSSKHASTVSPLTDILAHLSFVYGLFPDTSSSNALPDWSLSLEMQFYVFFPLLLVLMRWNSILWSIACLAIYIIANKYIAVFTTQPDKIFFYPQPSLLALKISCFAAGMLAVQLSHEKTKGRVGQFLMFAALIVIQQRPTFTGIAAIVLYIYYYSTNPDNTANQLGNRIAQMANRILGQGIPRFLGDVSYGVYLCHFLILFPVLSYAKRMGMLDSSSQWVRFGVATLLVAPLALLAAWLLHVLIERPFINFAKQIISNSPSLSAKLPSSASSSS